MKPHRFFSYQIGHGHQRTIWAHDEDDARARITAQYPCARGQRVVVQEWDASWQDVIAQHRRTTGAIA